MRRLLAALLPATAILAAVPAIPAGAISGGTTDWSSHRSVGALLGASGLPICSGVLVPSRTRGKVFLTAAHCLGWAGNRRTVRITFGATVRSGPVFYGTYRVMPGYVPRTYANDMAVVVFNNPPRISPTRLGGTNIRLRPGVTVTTVGYGTPNIGIRKWATEIVTGYGFPWLYLRRGSGNSCHGDSGGPDLVTPIGYRSPVVVAHTDQGTCHTNKDSLVTGQAVHHFVDYPG